MVSYKKSASLPITFSISYAVSVNSVDDDDDDILRSLENKIFNYFMFDYLSDQNILMLLKNNEFSNTILRIISMKNRKLEFEMKSKSYKCKICVMLFLNSIELTVHEINVHVDKLYQCQSCYKFSVILMSLMSIYRVHSRSDP